MRGKRIKQFILILCMVCLFGMNVQAEDVYTEFHVDNQKGKAGDVVTVPVEFNTGQEVGGFQISIYYDKEVLEFQSLEGTIRAVGKPDCQLCSYCWNGWE